MTSRSNRRGRYPLWYRVACSSVPMACVVILCVGAACGTPINLPMAASLGTLCGCVVRRVV